MVGWYDPGQLGRTAIKVLSSTIIGGQSDFRNIESLAVGTNEIYDYTRDENNKLAGEIWIDYVADLGDGWNSTYAIANTVAQEQLNLSGPDGPAHHTKRGTLLVFGGDEVYPTPSNHQYYKRLMRPYE